MSPVCSPTWALVPQMMSSTSAVTMPVRSRSALRTVAPRCCGWMSESAPLPALPTPRGVRHASIISASTMSRSFARRSSFSVRRSTWRHADGPVKAHILAVEIAVRYHRVGELRVFLRLAEPARERHLRRQRLLHPVGRPLQQWRVEDARQDGVDANGLAREIAGDGQRQSDDAGLRGGLGGLSDLAVFRGDRGSIDDRAPIAIRQNVECQHAGRALGDATKGADQIDLNDAFEIVERILFDLAR